MKKYDVVAVGSGTIDLTFKVPRLPGYDDKVVGELVGKMVGGTVANTACIMGKLGIKVTSLSTVGTDYDASMILDDFHRYGVDTQFVQVKEGIFPNMAIIYIDSSGEKSLIYAPNSESDSCMEMAREAIECSRYVYMMPSEINKFTEIAHYAKKCGTKVAIDVESHIKNSSENISTLLSLSDIAIFNKEGFKKSLKIEPSKELLCELVNKYALDSLVITCGSDGVIASNGDDYILHPGYKVDVVDTTGAGDTFNGAYIYAHINGLTLTESVRFASAAAAINISHVGARGKLSTEEEVKKFMIENL